IFFFFQAEDGIRDFHVTGVQTCALPIFALTREGGRLILVGGAAKTSVDWTRVWYRQITLAGIFAYGLAPFEGERRDIYETAIELLRRRDYGELGLVTHVFELEDYRAALHAALSKGGHRSIKVALRPDVRGH